MALNYILGELQHMLSRRVEENRLGLREEDCPDFDDSIQFASEEEAILALESAERVYPKE